MAAPGFRYPGATDIWAAMATDERTPRTAATIPTWRSGNSRKAWLSRERRRRCGPLAKRSRGNIRRTASKSVGDSVAGAADRQPPGDIVGTDERRRRRLAHWLRQHREPVAGAGRGQDARDRAPRRTRRRPGPRGAATVDRKLCARGAGRAGGSSAWRRCSCRESWRCHPPICPASTRCASTYLSSCSRSGSRWSRRCSSASCRLCRPRGSTCRAR